MIIRAETPSKTYDAIDFDVWTEIIGIEREVADQLYLDLCDGATGFGEWEVSVIPAPQAPIEDYERARFVEDRDFFFGDRS